MFSYKFISILEFYFNAYTERVLSVRLVLTIDSIILFAHAGGRRMSERDMTRVGTSSGDISKPPMPASSAGQQLLNSKSVPALHHVGNIGK